MTLIILTINLFFQPRIFNFLFLMILSLIILSTFLRAFVSLRYIISMDLMDFSHFHTFYFRTFIPLQFIRPLTDYLGQLGQLDQLGRRRAMAG